MVAMSQKETTDLREVKPTSHREVDANDERCRRDRGKTQRAQSETFSEMQTSIVQEAVQ